MKCPKCKTCELAKKQFNSPLSCSMCGGMWIPSGQLPLIADISSEINGDLSHESDHDKRTGLCPAGHGIMLRAQIDTEEQFYLEKCSACGGIWFDRGELQKITESNLVENLNSIWSRSWQRLQRGKKNKADFFTANKEILGDEVFQAVIELSTRLKDHPEKGRAIAFLQHELYQ